MAAAFTNIMDDDQSFRTILSNQITGTDGFGLSARGVTVFTADYDTAKDLMDSDEKINQTGYQKYKQHLQGPRHS